MDAGDQEEHFPEEWHRAMADAGWLGITVSLENGAAGLGVLDAAVMMHAVTGGGGAMAAVSSIHINLFGPHPVGVTSTPEQKERWPVPLIEGREKACIGVTAPDAGLDMTSIKTFATKVDGGYASTAARCGPRPPNGPTRSCC